MLSAVLVTLSGLGVVAVVVLASVEVVLPAAARPEDLSVRRCAVPSVERGSTRVAIGATEACSDGAATGSAATTFPEW